MKKGHFSVDGAEFLINGCNFLENVAVTVPAT